MMVENKSKSISEYRHDLKRNLSGIISGLSILSKEKGKLNSFSQSVLDELSQQSEITLQQLIEIFNNYEFVEKTGG